jgi:sugar/nucleoside kinase (ribokinase family)
MSRLAILSVGSLCLDTMVRLGTDGAPAPGELARVVSIDETVGGCCGNAAIALSRMGADVTVVAKLGTDAAGRLIEHTLSANKIDLATSASSGPTSRCVVISSEATDSRSFYYQPGVNEGLRHDDIVGVDLGDFDAVLVSDPFLTHLGRVELKRFLAEARDANVFTALDLCWDPVGEWGQVLDGCWELLDLVLASAEEAVNVTGVVECREAAQALYATGVRAAVVKAGAEGMFGCSAGVERHQPPVAVGVVDPTGAGDWCAAGTVVGALQGDFALALQVGALAGASALLSFGGSTAQPLPELLELLGGDGREALS